jgi:diadenylate cyclase
LSLDAIGSLLSEYSLQILDTLLVAVVLYYTFKYARGTKTALLLEALVIVGIVYFLCQHFHLITLVFLLERALLIGPIAVIVIFAPEIRSLLELASRRSRLMEWLAPREAEMPVQANSFFETLVDSAVLLGQQKLGALFVIERSERVDNYIVPGTRLDAVPSETLLRSIFEPKNPLHDGAVLIRADRIHSAGNFLPLSENATLDNALGTRHRAAIGLSERCDCIVLVISEERGELSIVFNGRIARGLTQQQFAEQLTALLDPNDNFATAVPRMVYI